MSKVFEFEVNTFVNGVPAVDGYFAEYLTEFFAGGHTPAIRDSLLGLEQAVAASDTDDVSEGYPVVLRYRFDSDRPQITSDFSKLLVEFFAGGHTPQIRDYLTKLDRSTNN